MSRQTQARPTAEVELAVKLEMVREAEVAQEPGKEAEAPETEMAVEVAMKLEPEMVPEVEPVTAPEAEAAQKPGMEAKMAVELIQAMAAEVEPVRIIRRL